MLSGTSAVLVCLATILAVALLLSPASPTCSRPGARTIMAYTQPWCGACKRLQPEWSRLEAMAGPQLAVLKVDCSAEACASVSKYPTIVCEGREYTGERSAEAMRGWALGL